MLKVEIRPQFQACNNLQALKQPRFYNALLTHFHTGSIYIYIFMFHNFTKYKLKHLAGALKLICVRMKREYFI